MRVKSAGVNPVDSLIRTGSHVIKPSLPYTPGLDGAGLVEGVGEHVSKFKVNVVNAHEILLICML